MTASTGDCNCSFHRVFCASCVGQLFWCRLVSGPGFRRRFREFHRTPPMLGFLLNIRADADADASGVSRSRSRCVPTAAFCLWHAETRSWRVLDARHGRVLLQQQPADPNRVDLLVWDLVTKEQRSPRSSGRCPARRRRHCGRGDCSAWLLRFSALSPLALATTLIATVDPSSWLLSSSMTLKRWTATCAPTHPNLLHGAKESPLASSGAPNGCPACVGNALYFGFVLSDSAQV